MVEIGEGFVLCLDCDDDEEDEGGGEVSCRLVDLATLRLPTDPPPFSLPPPVPPPISMYLLRDTITVA